MVSSPLGGPEPEIPRRRAPWWAAALLALGVAMVVGLTCGALSAHRTAQREDARGGASSPPLVEPPAPKRSSPGEALVGDPIDIAVKDVAVTYTVLRTATASADALGVAASRGQFLAAEVKIEARSGTVFVSPAEWSYVTDTGQELPFTMAPQKDRKLLEGGKLEAGKTVTGWVAFDVPGQQAQVSSGRISVALAGLAEEQRISWRL